MQTVASGRPAGIEAGIRNILGSSVELTDAENGVLNKKGVNCIHVFPNGIINWDSRPWTVTMTSAVNGNISRSGGWP